MRKSKIKILFAVFCFLALSAPIQSQKTSTPEEAINRIIDPGLIDGHDSKVIGGIGDAAAVTVTKVVRGRSLNPAEIDRVLIVLNMAFGDVTSGPEAEPRTTLFVLHQLEQSTSDVQLKERIAKTRNYVQEEFLKAKQRSTSK
jgi:hypothetical protein